MGLLDVAVGVMLWFLVGWGVNYGRSSLLVHLDIAQPSSGGHDLPALPAARTSRLSVQELVAEFELSISTVNALRQVLVEQALDPRAQPTSPQLQAVGAAVAAKMPELGYPAQGVRRLRVLPQGMLLSFGTAGVFSPWTGDPHIDGGLHPLQQTFVAAHEWGHSQGITDEGECNLVAYITCRDADDPVWVYAAEIAYLRYLRFAVSQNAPQLYPELLATLDTLVAADLDDIRRYSQRYREVAPALREAVYDRYLKSQGVADGMASYSQFIDWVVAARRLEQPLWRLWPLAAPMLPALDSLARVRSASSPDL